MKLASNMLSIVCASLAGVALAQDARSVSETAPPPAQVAADPRIAALEAEAERPDARPEAIYNLGVARYRAAQLEEARALFERAAAQAKASVAARSMYNRGTTRFAEAVRAMEAAGDAQAQGASQDAVQQVVQTLESALAELKDAVRAGPTNRDARANA
ncbi:MAG: hypothetical protein ACO3IB_13550, partial [Phycisphaerales bacterium]